MMTLVLSAIVLYLLAAALLFGRVAREEGGPGHGWQIPAIAAIVVHAGYHISVATHSASGPDMHFFAALSLVALGMAGLTSLVGVRGKMATLGVVVFPLAALLLVCYYGHAHAPSPARPRQLLTHAWLALLSYATLGIAALLAVMLWLQERALRRHEFHRWLRALPPLTELEFLLFRTITVGFVLLTLTLLSGLMFVEDLLAQQLLHKTVLSILSWLVFGALLLGRWRNGWRGAKAVHWTLAAVLLLGLAFFGSKFVIELVLSRVG